MAAVNIKFPGNLGQVVDAQALRGVPSYTLSGGLLYIVTNLGQAYTWDPGSTAADDGMTVIRPLDRTSIQAGRWLFEMEGFAPGPAGPAGNAAETLADLKAAPITNASMIYDGSPFTWTVGNYTGQADDINIVQSDFFPLSTGAWVRQGADKLSFVQPEAQAVLRSQQSKSEESLSVLDFIPVAEHSAIRAGTSTLDCGPYIQLADTAAAGRWLDFPPGRYRIATPITCWNPDTGFYIPTSKWRGAGRGRTVLLNAISNAPMISVKSPITPVEGVPSSFRGLTGFRLQDMTIDRSGSQTNQTGLYLRAAFYARISDVSFDNLSGKGVRVECSVGDNDASNTIRFERCLWYAVTGRALDIGDTDHNEISYVTVDQCRMEACGNALTGDQGVFKWKGQILRVRQTALIFCPSPVAFEIPGGPGLAQGAYLDQVTFEHNKGKDIYVTGVQVFVADRCQLYHNATGIATHGMHFNAASRTIRQVRITNTLVRFTGQNNAATAFTLEGPNAAPETCRVLNTVWDDFDYGGQTRFAGFRFDTVQQTCILTQDGATTIVLRPRKGEGNSMPLRLRGPGPAAASGQPAKVPSTSGEWVESDISAVSMDVSGVPANRYYVYLFDSNGAKALAVSAVPPVLSSQFGYRLKSDDPTYLYVGSFVMTESNTINTDAGWANPTVLYSNGQIGAPLYLWKEGAILRMSNSEPTAPGQGTAV